jgi:regulator of extracellular matrix RemA (YlzA/DUF370 family)
MQDPKGRLPPPTCLHQHRYKNYRSRINQYVSKAMVCSWSYSPSPSGIFSDSCVLWNIVLQAQLHFICRHVRLGIQWSTFGVRQILGWNFRMGHELPFLQVFPAYLTTGSCWRHWLRPFISCTVWDSDYAILQAVQSETVTPPFYKLYSLRQWLRPFISCTVWDSDCALLQAVQSETVTAPFYKLYSLRHWLRPFISLQSERVNAPLNKLHSLRQWLRPYISCTVWDTDCALK